MAVETGGGCWLWQHAKAGKGYGRIKRDGRMQYAHRVSYEIAVGEIPEGSLVCHKCDNPACINPAHLFLGSNDENMEDMVKKGRQARGESASAAALNEEQVLSIRASGLGKRQLARVFGVSESAVRHIRKRRTWRHLPESQLAL